MQNELILAPGEGKLVWLQGMGVRFLVCGEQTGGRCALVEHPIQPKALAAPLHTHENEDEISYVMEGRVGVQIGERIEVVGPGAVVFKPRGIPHAFWNAGETPARVLELITPAGFEGYFAAAAELFAGDGPPDPARAGALFAQYRLHMDIDSIPRLMQEHGLVGA